MAGAWEFGWDFAPEGKARTVRNRPNARPPSLRQAGLPPAMDTDASPGFPRMGLAGLRGILWLVRCGLFFAGSFSGNHLPRPHGSKTGHRLTGQGGLVPLLYGGHACCWPTSRVFGRIPCLDGRRSYPLETLRSLGTSTTCRPLPRVGLGCRPPLYACSGSSPATLSICRRFIRACLCSQAFPLFTLPDHQHVG